MARALYRVAAALGLCLACAPGISATPPAFDALIDQAKTSMMRDPTIARDRADAAAKLASAEPRSTEQTLALAKATWLSGEASVHLDDLDVAEPKIRSALAVVERLAPQSKLHGDVLLSLGGIANARSLPDQAMRHYQAAYQIYRKIGDRRQQAIALIDIGIIYLDAEDFERVLYYHAEAADIYSEDPGIAIAISNNRGNAFTQLKRYAEAEREYRQALSTAETMDSPLLVSRILYNIATAQIDRENLAGAKATVARGLEIAEQGDAPALKRLLLSTSARIAFKEGNSRAAADLIESAIAVPAGPVDTQTYRSLHDTAYRTYKQLGRSKEALRELETLRALWDEAQSLAKSTNTALLVAQFDFANQNGRIATLKAGQLERDIALTELRARQTQIVLVSILALVVVGAAFLAYNLRTLRRSRDKVAAANAELTIANRHLEEALKAKSQFLATTSHEIRTPLNGILGMAQVILAEPGLDPAVRERIGLLQDAGTTMRALVDDILDFAALDAGRLDIVRADADLRVLLRDIAAFWRGPATKAGLTLTLDVADDLHMIHEDVRRLRQILFNLLSNAIKFTPHGQVALRATVAGDAEGEHLLLAVEDSGIGIPADELQRVFEEFHQVDTGRTRQFSGSGLGLAISRALATAMGGTIDVRSVAGQGSTFTLRLPLRRVDPPAVATHDSGARGLGAARLLVVAGNPLAESTLRAILAPRAGGFVVAAGLAEAVDRCRTETFDLIVVEGGPLQTRTDGIALLTELLAGTETAAIRVAVLWKPDGRDLAALLGPRIAVIAKPVGGEALVAALEKIVDPPLGMSPNDVNGGNTDPVVTRVRATASA